MPDIQANGINIHYERTGGNKPPLILCHGIMDSGDCWPRVAPVLSTDYELIMLDARGHGRSDAPASGYSWRVLAEDVAAVISTLGLNKPGILGHSMGAATAAATAALYPQRVGFLVLEDPPWRDASATAAGDAVIADYRQRIVDRKTMTTEQMVEYTVRRDPGVSRWDKSEFAPWSEAKHRVSLDVVQLLGGAAPPYQDIVTRIACPTLLIVADPAHGAIVTPQTARAAAAMNPNIRVATIPDTGHNIRRESFEAYISAVSAFLKSL
jgi:pimeloyl-ACP methyl ester carboxylesterase